MFRWDDRQRQLVVDWLGTQVPGPRLSHMVRVEATAVALAQDYGIDAQRAAQAGLLHDLAKYYDPERLLSMAKAAQLPLDSVDEGHPHLLHGPVSAVVAQSQFQVQDAQVLAAIANHTVGTPGMDTLSCILFLADGIEPGRGSQSKLEAVRTASRKHLHQAVAMLCDLKLKRLIKKTGGHPSPHDFDAELGVTAGQPLTAPAPLCDQS